MDYKTYLTVECHLAKQTVEAYTSDIKHFYLVLSQQNVTPESVSKESVILFIDELNHRAYTKASIQRKVSAIKLYLYYLKSKKGVKTPSIDQLFTPRRSLHLPKTMRQDELDSVLTYGFINHRHALRNQLMIGLLFFAGCRVSEVIGLKHSQVFMDHLMIQGKGKKERMVPMAMGLKTRMDAYLNQMGDMDSPWVFPSKNSGHICRQTVNQVLKDVATACGLTSAISPHTLRHMFATQLLEKGLDLREVQLLLGHASIQTTQIYTHLEQSQLKRTFNRCHPLS